MILDYSVSPESRVSIVLFYYNKHIIIYIEEYGWIRGSREIVLLNFSSASNTSNWRLSINGKNFIIHYGSAL